MIILFFGAVGQRFNEKKLLLDPYAKVVARDVQWDDSLFPYISFYYLLLCGGAWVCAHACVRAFLCVCVHVYACFCLILISYKIGDPAADLAKDVCVCFFSLLLSTMTSQEFALFVSFKFF